MLKSKRSAGLLGLVATLLFTVGTGSASAKWGLYNKCGYETEPVNEHCYALAGDDIKTYAIVALQETRFASVPNCSYGFVTQEAWATPEAALPGNRFIETGQIIGREYCDQEPHIFTAEVSPDSNVNPYHFKESTLPTWEHQLNMYAISDIPTKNGDWHTYYRIPNESSHWTEFASYGGGWSPEMIEEEAGMEAADTEAPSYEGAEETLYTNSSIEWPVKNGYNWTGAYSWAEYGNTCIQALTGSGAGPGNNAEAVCNGD